MAKSNAAHQNELILAQKELALQVKKNGKLVEELSTANKELVIQKQGEEKNMEVNKEIKLTLEKSLQEIAGYKLVLDESSIVAFTDKNGIIKYANNNFCEISKYKREELIGKDHSLVNSGHHPKKFIRELWETIKSGQIWKGELKNKAKDGTTYWVDTTIVPFLNTQGKIYQYVAIRNDITAKKLLSQSSEYSRSLIEASLDPLVTISLQGKITDVNEASIKVTGVSRKNLVGTDFSDYFTEPKKALEGYQKVFEIGFVSDYPLTVRHTSGKLTDVLYNASVYKDDKGNVLGVFAAARDITAHKAEELIIANKELVIQNKEKEKKAEELSIANKELAFQNNEKEKRAAELVIANKELAFQNNEKEKRAAELVIANKELAFQNNEKEKRAVELVIANKELAFQNDEKEKRAEDLRIANKELLAFTFISSHDLQEPLRKIQTFVTIILEDENKNLSDKGKSIFQRMQSSAKRMQQLIDDLLAFSRINTTDHRFEKTELSIIVGELKAELKDVIQEKHATIESSELCTANIIPFQFRQLMYNLISNALKFSNPKVPSQIMIKSRIVKGNKLNNEKLSSEKNYCHIIVKDNGIGFESHFSERIFEVFQKLHNKEVYEGTGIGLAIVRKIVENHNGIITATSELHKGATFDIYIPAN